MLGPFIKEKKRLDKHLSGVIFLDGKDPPRQGDPE